ncbi:hypothetical protein PBS_11170 [Paraburkholderia sp. 2C]
MRNGGNDSLTDGLADPPARLAGAVRRFRFTFRFTSRVTFRVTSRLTSRWTSRSTSRRTAPPAYHPQLTGLLLLATVAR